ncbi:GntR family transcriptional regulator [Sulfuriferula nivalis]|uniref:GntR family transcriptional regulator n=2 Tax=Sulfuriferula nivalis TaxID=2675298 RepID=A0A809SDY0_9PROT|nr:GntR family transcriptional regulator [Sulfuriferula nivalis]
MEQIMATQNTSSSTTPAAAKRGLAGIDKKIYDAVFNAVMSQRLPPGTKLTEAHFCDLFKVSRTIVRKALQRLAHAHIVELKPNHGATIASPTPEETREIFAARRGIEAAIIPLAIARANKTQIARLRKMAKDEHAAYESGDRATWISMSGEFHIALAELAGNSILQRFLAELVSRCSLIIALYEAPGSVACSHDEHDRLIDVIASGDIPLSLKMMEQHLLAIEAKLNLNDEEDKIDLAEILGLSPI